MALAISPIDTAGQQSTGEKSGGDDVRRLSSSPGRGSGMGSGLGKWTNGDCRSWRVWSPDNLSFGGLRLLLSEWAIRCDFNFTQRASEMSEKRLGKSEMTTVETFASNTLRDYIAPRSAGANVKDRIRHAARTLGWSFTRTKDVWYADPRVSLSGAELRDIEDKSGISYGRAEVRSIEQLIAKADALLDSQDSDFHGPFVAAIRAFFGALDRPGTPGGR